MIDLRLQESAAMLAAKLEAKREVQTWAAKHADD